MKIVSVDHVQIAVPPDLERAAIVFYEYGLGLEPIFKPDATGDARGAWFDAGNVQVHIGVQDDFTPAKKAHVGFVVDDLENARRTLIAEGCPVKEGNSLPGFKRIFSEDPAGNRIEFLQKL